MTDQPQFDAYEELVSRLQTALRSIGTYRGPALPGDVITRFTVSVWTLATVQHPHGYDQLMVQQLLSDTAQIEVLLARGERSDIVTALLETQCDRVSQKAAELSVSIPPRLATTDHRLDLADITSKSRPPDEASRPQLEDAAGSYGVDARRERRSSVLMTWVAIFLIAGATASAFWIVNAAADAEVDRVWASVTGPAAVCLLCSIASLVCFRQSVMHLRASREYVRLERGFKALPEYLAPLPGHLQNLVRASMAQTLFPRILEDDDPGRQSAWPSSDAMLDALLGRNEDEEEVDEVEDENDQNGENGDVKVATI